MVTGRCEVFSGYKPREME